MDAAVWHGRRGLRVVNVEEPRPRPEEVKIAIKWGGSNSFCRTVYLDRHSLFCLLESPQLVLSPLQSRFEARRGCRKKRRQARGQPLRLHYERRRRMSPAKSSMLRHIFSQTHHMPQHRRFAGLLHSALNTHLSPCLGSEFEPRSSPGQRRRKP